MLPQNTIDGITLHIRHTMLPVSNMDRTVDFYTRLLGMDIQRIRDVPERNERVRYLGYGSEDEGPSLELIESRREPRQSSSGAVDGSHRALRIGLL
jgi:catechol 2,3-dioxygenase-like lactoylglutathione lyase family enzyme